jgi:hypothetical protein
MTAALLHMPGTGCGTRPKINSFGSYWGCNRLDEGIDGMPGYDPEAT